MTLLNITIMVLAVLAGGLILLLLLLWLMPKRKRADAEPSRPAAAARITLIPRVRRWGRPETADLIERMHELGFEEIGRYAVAETATLQLWAGRHPQDGIAAAIHDHGSLPPFFDLVRVYDDQATFTVSNNPVHDPASVPPHSGCIADWSLTPRAALETLRAQPLAGAVLPVDAGNFVQVFVERYARSMNHALATAAPPPDARVGEAVVPPPLPQPSQPQPQPQIDDRQAQSAAEMVRSARLSTLQEAIIDRFLQSGEIASHDWEQVRDRVIVVHDLLDREDAADLARMAADWEATEPLAAEILAQRLSPLDTFERIDAGLPESQRLRLLGEVDHPLYAQLRVAAV